AVPRSAGGGARGLPEGRAGLRSATALRAGRFLPLVHAVEEEGLAIPRLGRHRRGRDHPLRRRASCPGWRALKGRRMPSELPAAAAGSMTLGGDLVVRRMGFGAMRITGQGIWGDPPDRAKAQAVLRKAVELGVNLIDTADSYGPEVSEKIIAEALHPYPAGLVVATKGGLTRSGPGQWHRNGRPAHLRKACEGSLRRLGVERIDIYQLHAVDSNVPMEDSLGELIRLKEEGKIRHVALSNVSVEQLQRARKLVPIVSVQNRFNIADRASEDVLEVC